MRLSVEVHEWHDIVLSGCQRRGMGLAGETGELVDMLKKWIGHGHELNLTEVEKELGDILWYISEIATTLDLRLDQVAAKNMDKLVARYPEGFSEERSRNRGADR